MKTFSKINFQKCHHTPSNAKCKEMQKTRGNAKKLLPVKTSQDRVFKVIECCRTIEKNKDR